ncbi:MAG: hypothetical protein WA081_04675 [Desulfosalsimonadaceae bacterium]
MQNSGINSTASGTAEFTIYESDGDIGKALIPISALGLYVASLANFISAATKTAGSGVLGDSKSFVNVSCDFMGNGFGMMSDSEGTSMGIASCSTENNFVFPYFKDTAGEWNLQGIIIYNNSGVNGTATLNTYEKDGDKATAQITVNARGSYLNTIAGLNSMSTITSTSDSGILGDSDCFISVSCDFNGNGYGLAANTVTGESFGISPTYDMQNFTFPYLPPANSSFFLNIIITTYNNSTTLGTAKFTIYESDGDTGKAFTPVPAKGLYVDSFASLLSIATQTAGGGVLGDSKSFINISCDFMGNGFGMMSAIDGTSMEIASSSSLYIPSIPSSGIALFNPDASSFYLKNDLAGGTADTNFRFGPKNSSWVPVVGDWNGNGQATVGFYDSTQSRFYLKNSNAGGNSDVVFGFGPKLKNWIPISGDWDGDGQCSIGLYDPTSSTFYLKNALSGGNADHAFRFGPSNQGWQPIAGDWNGDGKDSIGLYSSQTGQIYLKNALSGGNADYSLRFGPKASNWKAVCGDWDGDGDDGIGLFNPSLSSFFLKNNFTGGPADITFDFSPDGSGWLPLAGSW